MTKFLQKLATEKIRPVLDDFTKTVYCEHKGCWRKAMWEIFAEVAVPPDSDEKFSSCNKHISKFVDHKVGEYSIVSMIPEDEIQ